MAGEIVSPPFDEKDNAAAILVSFANVSFLPFPGEVIVSPPSIGTGTGGGGGGTRAFGFIGEG